MHAQNIAGITVDQQHIAKPVIAHPQDFQSTESITPNTIPTSAPLASTVQVYDGVLEAVIGTSTYDLQTNRSVQSRFVNQGNGKLGAAWTMSQSTSSQYADRGTGYNHFDGSDWQDQPETRLENLRTGWPSLISLANGKEIFLSHVFTNPAGANEFGVRDNAGTGSWDIGTVADGSTNLAISWPRMTNGGTDGNTIHIIGHKKFPELEENGNNPGYISYSRSTDGGQTWDIHDSILPEIDSSHYTPFGGDGYTMASKGNTVAFIIGGTDRDVVLMKSTDNGTTWTKNKIWSFPIDKFDSNTHLVDSTTFPEGRINTADGSYSIVIDDNEEVHTFMGNYYMSNGTLDNGSSYYPLTDGIFHWTEDYGYADSLNDYQQFDTIAYVDSLDLGDGPDPTQYISSYFVSLTSYPHAAIAANGDIYVTYSGTVNGLYEDQEGAGEEYEKVYRHQFVVRSQDGGTTWSEPRDLMAEYVANNDPFIEGMYGNIVLQGDDMYVLYQRDEYPGIAVQPAEGNLHEIITNEIVVAKVAISDFNTIGIEEQNSLGALGVYPNPIINGKAMLQFDLNQTGSLQIDMVNLLGQTVSSQKMTVENKQEMPLDVSELGSGIYFVKATIGGSKITKKIVIQ